MIRLATIINRHERLFEIGLEKEKPTFKTICDEYMHIDKVEKEMAVVAKK